MLGLASSSAATDRAERESCTSMHSCIGAARYGALRGVRLSLHGSLRAEGVTGEQVGFSRGALRLRSTAAPRPRALHSSSCPRQEQCEYGPNEYGPNLKYEYKDQHNAQSCGLGRLARLRRTRWKALETGQLRRCSEQTISGVPACSLHSRWRSRRIARMRCVHSPGRRLTLPMSGRQTYPADCPLDWLG